MEPSSSFVQHHEFLDVSLLPFSFKTKPNTMSERAQERWTEGEPVVAKSRPACLASRNLSAKQSHSLDSGGSCSQWNQELGRNSMFMRTERSVRDRVQNPAASSQEWLRDDNPFSSVGRPVREMSERSSAGRLVRTKDEVGLPQHANLQQSIPQKLNCSGEEQIFDQKVNVLI